MRMLEPSNNANSRAGHDARPPPVEAWWDEGRCCVPVVDAQGRPTGVLITSREIGSAWRAAHAVSRRRIRWMSTRSEGVSGSLDLIANDVSAFFLRDDGIVEQRLPDGGGADPLLLDGLLDGQTTLGPEDQGAFLQHARTGGEYARRERSESFDDHSREAGFFWNSLSVRGRQELVLCARLALGNAQSDEIWRRVITELRRIDGELARRVAAGQRQPSGLSP